MGFWDNVKAIFTKQKEIEPQQEEQEILDYGNYPSCWACNKPIFNNKIKKLNGKKVHTKCFRSLKKIALSGESLKEFSQ